jgi:cytochrome c peroxidase
MIRAPSSNAGRRRFLAVAAGCLVLSAAGAGCGKGTDAKGGSPRLTASQPKALSSFVVLPAASAPVRVDFNGPRPAPEFTPRERVGRAIFFDTSLSEPPGTSCAGCHDAEHAFSGNHGSTTGVALGSRPGHFARRNTPSVLYMKYVPPLHFAREDEDDTDESPFGGVGWSGRADSVAEFSRLPLFDPDEMNNGSEAAVLAKLKKTVYAADLTRAFPNALQTPRAAIQAMGEALQAFLSSEAMSPFTSKFDDFIRGRVQLSPLEMKGLNVFRDPAKGFCHACHIVHAERNRPEASPFTNYGYDALAVPRNRAIVANADPDRYDLGLCERTQKRVPTASDPRWCGLFRTPSLRNVAARERLMHNGVFTSLRQAVAFYATRSTNPQQWYPPGLKFDDVPRKYLRNVNVLSLPYNRLEGEKPVLSDEDIDAIVAFLETLTDAPYRDAVAPK